MRSILKLQLITVSLLFLTLVACDSGDGILQPITSTDNKTPVALDQSTRTTNNIPINITLSGNDVVISNTVPISGINTPVKVEIENGEYSINGADFTALEGMITGQQSIRIRLISSSVASETTEASVTIGGVTGVFKATTSGDMLSPTPRIIFPTPRTLTTKDRIMVRGNTSDNGRVVAVTVMSR